MTTSFMGTAVVRERLVFRVEICEGAIASDKQSLRAGLREAWQSSVKKNRSMSYYVYILSSRNHTVLYTGVTNDSNRTDDL